MHAAAPTRSSAAASAPGDELMKSTLWGPMEGSRGGLWGAMEGSQGSQCRAHLSDSHRIDEASNRGPRRREEQRRSHEQRLLEAFRVLVLPMEGSHGGYWSCPRKGPLEGSDGGVPRRGAMRGAPWRGPMEGCHMEGFHMEGCHGGVPWRGAT